MTLIHRSPSATTSRPHGCGPRAWLAAIATALLGVSANAAIIIDNTVNGAITNDFEGQTLGSQVGLVSETGATYGERFEGQTLSTAGGFDVLSGAPTAALNLLANDVATDNVGIVNAGSQVIFGDLNGEIGEGALSVLFDAATDVFGFLLVGSNLSGEITVSFFGMAGIELGTISQASSGGFFGFRATGGDLIRGVSITNTDPSGVGFDDVTFNALAVAEPNVLALIGLGVLGFSVTGRRTRLIGSRYAYGNM
ncbi:MAG: hypothetical protein AAF184_24490 [Pseudomonadota bacterium]